MATIRPFRGLHYNPKVISNLSDVIIPPYDTIAEGDDKRYMARSPYNFAHVLLPSKPEDDYQRSKDLLHKWREHQILIVDNAPGFYLYRQTFTLNGVAHARNLLLASVDLHEFSDGVIRPHENTFGKYKKDRLQILKQTECNLCQIFTMVQDPDGYLHSLYERWEYKAPLLHGKTDEGVEHSLWRIDASEAEGLASFFADKPLYIVDGHHRYESALQYAREKQVLGQSGQPASSLVFGIANSFDPALIVLPTHRRIRIATDDSTIEKIEKLFHLSALSPNDLKTFTGKPHKTPEFGLSIGGDLYRCAPKNPDFETSLHKLAVYWSDEVLMNEVLGITKDTRGQYVTYEKDTMKLWETRKDTDIVVFHSAPTISEIMEVADEKLFLPQKSTYFYPKLASGLIMRDLKA